MNEFLDRPTLRMWHRHLRAIRWEQRLARAPYYRLMTLGLLIIACVVLISAVLILRTHPVVGPGR